MANKQLSSAFLDRNDFSSYATGWLYDCEIRQHSPRTVELRKTIIDKFEWWLDQKQISRIDAMSLRQFLHYVANGHKEEGGRWGDPLKNTAPKPATVQLYHRHIRACLNWIVEEGAIDASPMKTIKAPIDRPDQIQPFSTEQVGLLLAACKKGRMWRRDEAICLLLLDTGIRVSELTSLNKSDLDISVRSAVVEGKGGKKRTINFGTRTARALWAYQNTLGERPDDDPVFVSQNRERMTPNGVLQMMNRLERESGVTGIRVSPHTFRHTCAVMFLRNGGNQFTLMNMLGHTDTQQTNRYVNFAQADVAKQHRQFSPVESLRKRR